VKHCEGYVKALKSFQLSIEEVGCSVSTSARLLSDYALALSRAFKEKEKKELWFNGG